MRNKSEYTISFPEPIEAFNMDEAMDIFLDLLLSGKLAIGINKQNRPRTYRVKEQSSAKDFEEGSSDGS